MIAGFEHPTSGRVLLHGEDVSRVPPYDRDVNTVFQDYALFPHMTVGENIEFGLKVRRVPRASGAHGQRKRSGSYTSTATAIGASPSCRADNGSGSRSRVRSSTDRGSSCSTNRSARST